MGLASRHASVQGDARTAIRILNMRIAHAKAADDSAVERDLLLCLAQMQSHAGDPDAALESIREARSIRTSAPPPLPIDEVEASLVAVSNGDPKAFQTLVGMKAHYHSEGREWDAARIALDLSATHIRRHEPTPAADEAAFALTVFTAAKDKYGLRVAKLNLLSALSAIPERSNEARVLLAELRADPAESPRQRAVLCNVLGRTARERGNLSDAKAYAQEAVTIGRTLGDAGVVCTNLINLGNAFRDERNWSAATAAYEAADKMAREAKLTIMEASAQELLASVYNRKGDGARAVQHATYAISLVGNGVSPRTEASAHEELAEAIELTGAFTDAWKVWLRYADLEARSENDIEAASYGLMRAAALMLKKNARSAYLEAYRALFPTRFASAAGLADIERMAEDIGRLLDAISLRCIFGIAAYHARFLFDGTLNAFARRVFLTVFHSLFDRTVTLTPAKRLRAALALTMAVPPGTLSMRDIVDVGETLERSGFDVSFRAHSDGAGHWAVTLPLGRSVIVTVSQMDDRPDVALVTLCLALMLVAFADAIRDDVLAGSDPHRSEACIDVCAFDEAALLLPLQNVGLTSLHKGCAVTRATDPGAGAPILVITSNSLTKDWIVGSGKANEGQELFANVLVELIYHLQAGVIELELLRPKVISVVKRTIV